MTRSPALPRRGRWLLALAPLLLAAAPAEGFVLLRYRFSPCDFPCTSDVDVERSLREAPRWNAGPSAFPTLADGIQVAVQPGFAETFAAGNTLSAADYEQGLADAFGAWETPELGFDITFGASAGSEIDVFVTDSLDPLFSTNLFSGLTFTHRGFRQNRVLTNGQIVPGDAITGVEIYIAYDRLWQFFEIWKFNGFLDEADRLARYVDLLIHEIGHGIGLGHPNENPEYNLDDDGDPFTVFEPDPYAPWEGLSLSNVVDPNAIMRGGLPLDLTTLAATELFPDDRSGLNALYPSVPEPGAPWLVAVGSAALWLAARSRRSL